MKPGMPSGHGKTVERMGSAPNPGSCIRIRKRGRYPQSVGVRHTAPGRGGRGRSGGSRDPSPDTHNMPPPSQSGGYHQGGGAFAQDYSTPWSSVVQRRPEEFPSMGEPGAESQVLDQRGRPRHRPGYRPPPYQGSGERPHGPESSPSQTMTTLTPSRNVPGSDRNETATIASVEPAASASASIPKDALVTPFVSARPFFDAAEKVSSEIQVAAFKEWQERSIQMGVEFMNRLGKVSLECIHGIQKAEKETLQKDASEHLKKEVTAAVEAQKKAHSSTEYLRKQNEKLNKTNEELNTKFFECFGVMLDEWDGSPESAFRLLKDKYSKK